MEVLKRDGSTTEPVKLDKITARIKKQTYDLNQDYIDYMEVVKKTISGSSQRLSIFLLKSCQSTLNINNLTKEFLSFESSVKRDLSS